MTQEIVITATEVALARDEFLTQTQVNQLVQTGKKRRIKVMAPVAEVTPEPTVEAAPTINIRTVVAPVEVAAPADPYENYSPGMKKLVGHLQSVRETHVLSVETRNLIDLAERGQVATDFDSFSDSQLQGFVDTLRNQLPRVNQEMRDFMSKVASAKAIIIESDFI